LTGNITEKDGDPYIHLHINLTGKDYEAIGGHLNKAMISVTGEIVVTSIEGMINRYHVKQSGLNLLDI